jgi:hypothetical protein
MWLLTRALSTSAGNDLAAGSWAVRAIRLRCPWRNAAESPKAAYWLGVFRPKLVLDSVENPLLVVTRAHIYLPDTPLDFVADRHSREAILARTVVRAFHLLQRRTARHPHHAAPPHT